MDNIVSYYLARFRASLQIDSNVKVRVAKELYTHLKDKIQELKEEDFSDE